MAIDGANSFIINSFIACFLITASIIIGGIIIDTALYLEIKNNAFVITITFYRETINKIMKTHVPLSISYGIFAMLLILLESITVNIAITRTVSKRSND
jgi:hypothetical protein